LLQNKLINTGLKIYTLRPDLLKVSQLVFLALSWISTAKENLNMLLLGYSIRYWRKAKEGQERRQIYSQEAYYRNKMHS
jgi:hypothetical protein